MLRARATVKLDNTIRDNMNGFQKNRFSSGLVTVVDPSVHSSSSMVLSPSTVELGIKPADGQVLLRLFRRSFVGLLKPDCMLGKSAEV